MRLTLEPLSASAVAELAEPYGADADELHEQDRRQSVLRHRGARRRRRARAGQRPRRRAGARGAARPRRAGTARRGGDRAAARRAVAARRRSPATGSSISRNASHRGCCTPSATRSRSGTRSRASPSRRRCRPTGRLALHRLALPALTGATGKRIDLRRLAHHAEAAGDGDAVLRLAPDRGRARGRGSARTARLPRSSLARCVSPTACSRKERAELLERRSYECYLTSAIGDDDRCSHEQRTRRAPRARRPPARGRRSAMALAAHLVRRRQRAAPRAKRGAPSSCWRACRPGRELAMAYSTMAQLRNARLRRRRRRASGAERAVELAERLRRAGEPRPRAQQHRHGRAPRRRPRRRRRSSRAAWRSRSRRGSRTTRRARTRTSRRRPSRCATTRAPTAIWRTGSRTAATATSTRACCT